MGTSLATAVPSERDIGRYTERRIMPRVCTERSEHGEDMDIDIMLESASGRENAAPPST